MDFGCHRPDMKAGPSPWGGSRPSLLRRRYKTMGGNVLLYILIAIALLAALTYSMTKEGGTKASVHLAHKTSQELYVQVNLIRSAVLECTLAYPAGGGDLYPAGSPDGVIDADDNPNNPYPLNPSSPLNPDGAAANDNVRNLTCIGAPAGSRSIFQGAGTQGRYLPPPPPGFGEWTYINHGDSSTPTEGVRIQIIASDNATNRDALNRLMTKFSACQADLDYGGCGATCFTAWIQRTSCP